MTARREVDGVRKEKERLTAAMPLKLKVISWSINGSSWTLETWKVLRQSSKCCPKSWFQSGNETKRDGTYLSRNFATLGPLPDSRRVLLLDGDVLLNNIISRNPSVYSPSWRLLTWEIIIINNPGTWNLWSYSRNSFILLFFGRFLHTLLVSSC